MDRVLVDKTLIKEAMDAIADKSAQLVKLAAQVEELVIYKRVAELVAKGQIDPTDTLAKVAEFSKDPDSLRLLEKQAKLSWDTCVTPVESLGTQTGNMTALEHFAIDLESILLN